MKTRRIPAQQPRDEIRLAAERLVHDWIPVGGPWRQAMNALEDALQAAEERGRREMREEAAAMFARRPGIFAETAAYEIRNLPDKAGR